jgi:N-acetyl-alpha-D-glucosaminyl L-malate synthase BshA
VKRTDDVFEAFELARKSTSRRMHLVLVGDGPERGTLERKVRKHGAQDCVHFLGRQEAVEEILPRADVFLMPSETESFGLSALEAMACGVPVVCTNVGGLPEIVEHGKEGFLCAVGDVESMANSIVALVDCDERSCEYAAAARKKALNFEQSRVVPQYENLYRTLVEV